MRKATRQSLSVPSPRSTTDCTPWVLGGLWPADLERVTPETAPLAEYLKRDLQRIAASANERLRAIAEAGLARRTREAEEFRVINVARAFAVLRVESTIRQLRREPLGFAPEMLSINGSRHRVVEASKTTAKPPPSRHRKPDPAEFGWDYPDAANGTAEAVRPRTEAVEPEMVADPVRPESVLVEADFTVTDIAPEIVVPDESAAPLSAPPGLEPQESTERRLKRLLRYVARQEPGLRWGIGEFADGSTLLVTDLAYGWIPPGIEVPEGVELPTPLNRVRDIAAMLADSKTSQTYVPGDPFGTATEAGVATLPSETARKLDMPTDFVNQLAEATRGRPGLPRLAHAIAGAAASGSAVPDTELDVLRVHSDTARYQLLAQYPDIDMELLLNCLLLAATEATAIGDGVAAGYHFAWFRVLSDPPGGRRAPVI